MTAKLRFLVHLPDRETIQRTLPSVFKSKFPKLTSIVDCFEIFIDRPKNLHARAKVYSNYKKHSTVKVFIACNLRFSDIFIESMGWSCFRQWTCSFKWIYKPEIPPTRRSNPCRPWLHTCGWLCCLLLIIPSFTKGKKQLSAKEVETSRKISSVRIHIERVIGLMKNHYTI
jgi:hypothetical protein